MGINLAEKERIQNQEINQQQVFPIRAVENGATVAILVLYLTWQNCTVGLRPVTWFDEVLLCAGSSSDMLAQCYVLPL